MAVLKDLVSILAINCGSSSLKASLFSWNPRAKEFERLLDGSVDGINTTPVMKVNGKEVPIEQKVTYISSALECLLNFLYKNPELEYAINQIAGIGHRVVHGGNFKKSMKITPRVIDEINTASELAPLHNPSCLAGISAAVQFFGEKLPHVAVFDTAFHQTIPPYASTYGLPHKISQEYKIKKYGFHGIAHAFLWEKYLSTYHQPGKKKVITMQLGSGCSIAAINDGQSLDTSMGFTPLEGLLMSTRAGDMDPAIIGFLCAKKNMTPNEVINLCNFDSGLWGVSDHLSKDMRELIESSSTNPQAELAVEIFVYRLTKYIGAYITVLEGLDVLIFSGGIGENSSYIREKVVSKFDWFGIVLDKEKNQEAVRLSPGSIHKLSATNSTVEVFALGCDENFYIAEETLRLIR